MFRKLPDQQQTIVLVVDTDIDVAAGLRAAIEALGLHAIAVTDFQAARRELRGRDIAAVVANLRLGPYNGIHLAYTAKHTRPETRVMIYALHHDGLLAKEAQRAGAFYERQPLVHYVLGRFMAADLPSADRRDSSAKDRRNMFRGGRRVTDLSSLHPAGSSSL